MPRGDVKAGPGAVGRLCAFGLACVLPALAAIADAQPVAVEVAWAEAAFDQRTGQPLVSFRLTPSSARLFADLTAQNVGRVLEIRVDGRVHGRPVVREPILGGSGQIIGIASVDEAKALAARLIAGTARLEFEVASN